MAGVLRGEVYWADLGSPAGHEQGGPRPVLVISHDPFNRRSETVIVLAVTSQPQRAGYPMAHKLGSGDLPKESWVKMTQVRTLSAGRLRERIGFVDDDELTEIVEGLIELVG
ncbi:MAG: type II toxin-antitoxin system PemK/MazF family toxin [Armatimonadota bacterium]